MKKTILSSAILISAFSTSTLIAGHNETIRDNQCKWWQPAKYKAQTHMGFNGQGGTSGNETSCHQADRVKVLNDFLGCFGRAESHAGLIATWGSVFTCPS